MTLEELYDKKYLLSDGEIISYKVDNSAYDDKISKSLNATILIKATQLLTGKKYRNCILSLNLHYLVEVRIFDNEEIGGNYSDITIAKLNNGDFYISFDPLGNSNVPNEKDNFVFISKELQIEEQTIKSEVI